MSDRERAMLAYAVEITEDATRVSPATLRPVYEELLFGRGPCP